MKNLQKMNDYLTSQGILKITLNTLTGVTNGMVALALVVDTLSRLYRLYCVENYKERKEGQVICSARKVSKQNRTA
jgi:hypothetical protein